MPREPWWVQNALFESNIVEVHIHLGYIAEPEHFQLQVETRDPITGTLLDLWAMPHGQHSDLAAMLLKGLRESLHQIDRNGHATETARQQLRIVAQRISELLEL
jgi:hypothetical protein